MSMREVHHVREDNKYKVRWGRILDEFIRKAKEILSPWMVNDKVFARLGFAGFQQSILDTAVKLHRDLKLSSHSYEWKTFKNLNKLTPEQLLSDWHLKDASAWEPVNVETQVGKALYSLNPSLVRIQRDGKAAKVI